MALVVITGGARSGKSAAAEKLALARAALGAHVVVAVFGHSDGGRDAEFAERIAHHQSGRPAHFETREVSVGSAWIGDVADDELLVVDCLGTALGRVMEDAWDSLPDAGRLADAEACGLPAGFEETCESALDAFVEALLGRSGDTIVVTNEVGDGIVPVFATGRLFRDLLGRANRTLVDRGDAAYLAVAGRLLDLSALPREAHWPED